MGGYQSDDSVDLSSQFDSSDSSDSSDSEWHCRWTCDTRCLKHKSVIIQLLEWFWPEQTRHHIKRNMFVWYGNGKCELVSFNVAKLTRLLQVIWTFWLLDKFMMLHLNERNELFFGNVTVKAVFVRMHVQP